MATIVWERIDRIHCDRVKEEVDLLEERIYPADTLPAPGVPFQVRQRKCALGLECNLEGYRCKWSFANPNYDPFESKPPAGSEARR